MGANLVSSSPLRVGQFSAYHGDRPDGMDELLASGVDVLTGDYLAELTMLVLRKNQMRGGVGYAASFVEQLERYLPRIAERGVKVVTNAGGLDPRACAEAVREACIRQGVDLRVAAVTGDDLRNDLSEVLGADAVLRNVDTGEDLVVADHEILTANAYLGAWPIVDALDAGADIVICPRMTDASLVVGPAAWHFGWARDDWNALAGGVVAGHLIECCGQVTGGNFALFHEHGDLGLPGMPIAEIHPDASCVITKPDGSGGLVSTDTVSAQLLYEIGGPEYQNPDVIVDLGAVVPEQDGPDRVRVAGARGRAPNGRTKLSLTFEGGYRNTMTVGLTGLHLREKLAWLRRAVERAVGPPESFEAFRWTVVGPARESDGDQDQETAWAVISVRDPDQAKVGRVAFADRIVQLGTNNVPGFYLTTPPQRERLFGVQWPCLVEKKHVQPVVHHDDATAVEVGWPQWCEDGTPAERPVLDLPPVPTGPTVARPLGTLVGTRSGDKGGIANLGVWTRSGAAYAWLLETLTVDRLRELLPEAAGLRIERHELASLNAVNFLLVGYLEQGVSSCLRIDPQAKGLGEYLASRVLEIPVSLVDGGERT
ncbi:hypothetical protein AD006_28510 (plasmid) [Pseudonocardia sp. EC080610-09]|uniref:acyclic terpene utilization AtuA family protein n=1 Tax=unclassified Pseudonocardia TaxID=2619320 RepID=UPI000705BE7C|nr:MULTISPECIES: acyclic terpene utilization AtuA family protein [unclassified Pseudonocardia]ALL79271.1 hypothetical protein AD006_28510 [Pseudonocardia sp. EC080610-09]ALL85241.1 hypothetical protein AD017_28900 [Pseudonocardia sp. EC080619-01]